MTDRPILFSAPMVRALLAGTKTQTRRALNPQPQEDIGIHLAERPLRFAVGDRLWVREAWKAPAMFDGDAPRDLAPSTAVSFVADDRLWPVARYRQAMHMPRWASRLTLTVTEVRVERLQSISPSDAITEGIHQIPSNAALTEFQIYDPKTNDRTTTDPVASYASLWAAINGASAWAANPWVVAVSFTVHHHNIDEERADAR